MSVLAGSSEGSDRREQNHTPNEWVHILQESDGSLPQIIVTETQSIQASDRPQRSWNNAQCREWIAALLMEKVGKEKIEADFWASRFKGRGEDMWYYGSNDWMNIVCSMYGRNIYWKVMEAKEREEALARDFEIPGVEVEGKEDQRCSVA